MRFSSTPLTPGTFWIAASSAERRSGWPKVKLSGLNRPGDASAAMTRGMTSPGYARAARRKTDAVDDVFELGALVGRVLDAAERIGRDEVGRPASGPGRHGVCA